MLIELKRQSSNEDIDPDYLRQVASTLLVRQFVYSDIDKDRKLYIAIVNNRKYFEILFDAINHTFLYDQEVGMVGIIPRGRTSSLRLKAQEALLLLILRLIYEEALEEFSIKNGCVYTNSNKVLDKFSLATGPEKRPNLTDLRRILIDFKRLGLIDGIVEDDRIFDFRIRPAIRLIVNEGWAKTLELYSVNPENFPSEEDDIEQEDHDIDERDI